MCPTFKNTVHCFFMQRNAETTKKRSYAKKRPLSKETAKCNRKQRNESSPGGCILFVAVSLKKTFYD